MRAPPLGTQDGAEEEDCLASTSEPGAGGDDSSPSSSSYVSRHHLRVMTWNVNRAEPSGAAFDGVLAHVRSLPHAPHVIALQLASRAFVHALAAGLGWSPHATHHSTPGGDWGGETHGNAVLVDHGSGYLPTDATEVQLPGSPPRSVLAVEVTLPVGADGERTSSGSAGSTRRRRTEAVWVCSIHLDNTREALRLAQVAEAVRRLRKLGPHVLCGDFNALRAADLPHHQWRDLVALAAKNGWEPRQERVMRYLLGKRRSINPRDARDVPPEDTAAARGATPEDTEAARGATPEDESDGGGAGYDDAWAAAGDGASGPLHTFRLPPTCGSIWVRLDYVLLSSDLVGTAEAVITTPVAGASNHSAVAACLRLH